jgi:hypothetical protein
LHGSTPRGRSSHHPPPRPACMHSIAQALWSRQLRRPHPPFPVPAVPHRTSGLVWSGDANEIPTRSAVGDETRAQLDASTILRDLWRFFLRATAPGAGGRDTEERKLCAPLRPRATSASSFMACQIFCLFGQGRQRRRGVAWDEAERNSSVCRRSSRRPPHGAC